MVYTLIKALTSEVESKGGKIGTPIIGYVLLNHETGKKEVHNKQDAYALVSLHGATNAEAHVRQGIVDGEELTVFYLKPTDGRKINQYLLSVDETKPKEKAPLDNKILERIYGIGDNLESDPQKSSGDTYYLLVKMVSLIKQNDIDTIVEMKRLLDDETVAARYKDYSSYVLGRVHTLIELGTWLGKEN